MIKSNGNQLRGFNWRYERGNDNMSLISQRKVVLYIAASIDGYIAGENGEIGWLNEFEGEGDNGFASLYQTNHSRKRNSAF